MNTLVNTVVDGGNRRVLVSTAKNVITRQRYETMVFPIVDGEPDFYNSLVADIHDGHTQVLNTEAIDALRSHVEVCRFYGARSIPLNFDEMLRNY